MKKISRSISFRCPTSYFQGILSPHRKYQPAKIKPLLVVAISNLDTCNKFYKVAVGSNSTKTDSKNSQGLV